MRAHTHIRDIIQNAKEGLRILFSRYIPPTQNFSFFFFFFIVYIFSRFRYDAPPSRVMRILYSNAENDDNNNNKKNQRKLVLLDRRAAII